MSLYGFNPPGKDTRQQPDKDNLFLAMRDALLGVAILFMMMYGLWFFVKDIHQNNIPPVSTKQ